MQNIKQIVALDTFPVLHPVLRTEKPIESCHFDENTLKTTVHFGFYDNEKQQELFHYSNRKMIYLLHKNSFKFGVWQF